MATTYKNGQMRPFLTRLITLDLTGQTDVTVPARLRVIDAVFVNWKAAPGNDTYGIVAYPSGTNVIVRSTHAGTTKVTLLVIGTN